MPATLSAPIKWAQRADSLYITISVPDITGETCTIEDDRLTFKGKSGDEEVREGRRGPRRGGGARNADGERGS